MVILDKLTKSIITPCTTNSQVTEGTVVCMLATGLVMYGLQTSSAEVDLISNKLNHSF